MLRIPIGRSVCLLLPESAGHSKRACAGLSSGWPQRQHEASSEMPIHARYSPNRPCAVMNCIVARVISWKSFGGENSNEVSRPFANAGDRLLVPVAVTISYSMIGVSLRKAISLPLFGYCTMAMDFIE